jgi:hypothetical protein
MPSRQLARQRGLFRPTLTQTSRQSSLLSALVVAVRLQQQTDRRVLVAAVAAGRALSSH